MSTPSIDPNRVFFKFNYHNTATQNIAMFCVPLTLLPEPYRSTAIGEVTKFKALYQEMSPSVEQRLKHWKEECGHSVYEVTSIQPPKLRGIKASEILTRFGKSFTAIFNEALGSRASRVGILPSKGYNATLMLSDTPQVTLKEAAHVRFAMQIFFDEAIKLIQEIKPFFSPEEPFLLVWDSLSQILIHASKDPPSSDVLQITSSLWAEVNWLLQSGLTENELKHLDKRDGCFEAIIKLLQSLPENLVSLGLGKVVSPWLKLLNQLVSSKEPLKQEFCKELFKVMYLRLPQNEKTVLLEKKYTGFLTEWQVHFIRLTTYFHEYIKVSLANDKDLNEKSTQMITALSAQNWVSTYANIKSLMSKFEELCEPKNIHLVMREDGSGQIRVRTQEQCNQLRGLAFLKIIEKNFELILKNGEIFRPIARQAYHVLKETYHSISSSRAISLKEDNEVERWALKLAEMNIPFLLEVCKNFQKAKDQLQTVYENLFTPKLNSQLVLLFQNLDEKQYEDLPQVYLDVAETISLHFSQWETELRNLNHAVTAVQDVCLLTLLDGKAPKIEMNLLIEQFQKWNTHLQSLAVQPTVFFNAFQQLIQINQRITTSLRATSKVSLVFSTEGELTIVLFQTKKSLFQEYQNQLKSAENSTENHFEMELSSENPLQEKLEAIFKETKTRKIKMDLVKLLEEYKLVTSLKRGRGGRFKIFFNKVLLVLPAHEELKLGTKLAIQKQVLEKIQQKLLQK